MVNELRRSPPDLLDSTSDLLAALHLIDRNNGRMNNSTDDMDTDLAPEVPDTPDRPTMMHSVDGSPNALPSGRRMGHTNNKYDRRRKDSGTREAGGSSRHTSNNYARRLKDSGTHEAGGSSTALNDSELMLRRARLKCLISKTLDTKSSPEALGTTLELQEARVSNGGRKSAKTVESSWTSPFPQRRDLKRKNGKAPCGESSIGLSLDREDAELMLRDKGLGIDLSSVPQAKTEQVLQKSLQLDASQMKTGRRQLRSNGSLSRCNTVKSNIRAKVDGQNIIEPVGGEAFSSFAGISDQHNRKEVDMHRQRECVTWDKNVAKYNVGKAFSECRDGDLSHQISIVGPYSEANHADKKKGKLKLDDIAVGNMQCAKAKTWSGRVWLTSDKEVTLIADVDDTPRSSEDLSRRTTQNCTEKASAYSSHEIAGASKRKDTNNHLSEQSHEIAVEDRDFVNLVHDSPELPVTHHELNPSPSRASFQSESESRRRQRPRKLMKGKGKCSSLCSISVESSSSVFEDLEISYLQSSGQSSNSKSTTTLNSQRHGIILGPVIEVDELHSPEVRCSSLQGRSCRVDDSSARARQVESDEILALQLQEKLYHESPGFGDTQETDATVAWSLQEEEDARHAASIVRRGQFHPRDAAIAHLYAHYPRASEQLTNRARVLTSRRMAQLRRNFDSPEVDLESRLNFLEALESAFDNSNDMVTSNNFLQIQRDFNEDDYEMLLTLDDDNHQHVGASESQINSLPQSVIQSDSIEEACAVCLETPSAGDIIRHLPCLHKFHKECIDTWLRRRTACPICKFGIT